MVLQSLVDLYEVLAQKGKVDRLGWCKVKVSYGLVLDKEGNLTNIIPLKELDSNGKKQVAKSVSMPMQMKRSGKSPPPYFLCDKSGYMFGCDEKGRNIKYFENAKELHYKILTNVQSDSVSAILNFFKSWQPEHTQVRLREIGCSEDAITDIIKKGVNLVLMPFGRLVTECLEICDAWDNYYHKNKDKNEIGICLVTGQKLPMESVHPRIKDVVGAKKQISLVSANKDSFESYGKKKNHNSPVSKYAAFAYTTALNFLLSQKEYVRFYGDTTIVCWTSDYNEGYQDIMTEIFGDNNYIIQRDLWDTVKKLSQGLTVKWEENHLNPENQFYVLGLVPKEGRVFVRFFLQNTFGEFMKNVQLHNEQMSIVVPDSVKNPHFPVWKILRETVRQESKGKKTKLSTDEKQKKKDDKKLKNEDVKPKLAGDMIYSMLTGYKYPATLYNNIMIRIKAERDVDIERDAIRAAVIKAYLLRNYTEYKEELTVKLNFECTDKAYILGRLFSLLEEIQYLAHCKSKDNNSETEDKNSKKDINTTIKDSYFASASSTPAVVFPMLIDLAQKHLKKIKIDRPGKCKAKQIELTELVSKLDEELPSTMTMQEKGVFQIGYYHQTQYRFTKKEDK